MPRRAFCIILPDTTLVTSTPLSAASRTGLPLTGFTTPFPTASDLYGSPFPPRGLTRCTLSARSFSLFRFHHLRTYCARSLPATPALRTHHHRTPGTSAAYAAAVRDTIYLFWFGPHQVHCGRTHRLRTFLLHRFGSPFLTRTNTIKFTAHTRAFACRFTPPSCRTRIPFSCAAIFSTRCLARRSCACVFFAAVSFCAFLGRRAWTHFCAILRSFTRIVSTPPRATSRISRTFAVARVCIHSRTTFHHCLVFFTTCAACAHYLPYAARFCGSSHTSFLAWFLPLRFGLRYGFSSTGLTPFHTAMPFPCPHTYRFPALRCRSAVHQTFGFARLPAFLAFSTVLRSLHTDSPLAFGLHAPRLVCASLELTLAFATSHIPHPLGHLPTVCR